MSAPWPSALTFKKTERVLSITFDDGKSFGIPFKLLREESPSAENKGHGNGPPPPQPPVPDDIAVEDAVRVGRYAVRIKFSDGHSTGLYTWPLLRELGERALESVVSD